MTRPDLSPLKALIPGRGMLIAMLALLLLFLWYLYRADGHADHLVKRNFNFLNQVNTNINASIESARAAVPFNSGIVHQCLALHLGSRAAYDNVDQIIKACLRELRQRLLDHGSLVTDAGQLGYSVQEIPALDKAPDKIIRPGTTLTPEIRVSDISRQHNTTITSRGIRSNFTMLMALRHLPSDSRKPGRDERWLQASLSLTIAWENIRGFDSRESFFAALLVAKSNGAGSKVVVSNTELPLVSDSAELTSLLRSRSGYERFSDSSELERSHGRWLAGDDDSPGIAAPVKFSQSSVVPVEIGGFSYLAFVQPFRSDFQLQLDGTTPEGLVLIGLIAERDFNKNKFSIPYNIFTYALLLLIMSVLLLNFARLHLIRDRGVIHREDWILAMLSMLGITSVLVLLIVHWTGSREFRIVYDNDLTSLHQWISHNFEQEITHKLTAMDGAATTILNSKAPDSLKNSCSNWKQSDRKHTCESSTVLPLFPTMFVLNKQGRQEFAYITFRKDSPQLGFKVPNRWYFRALQDNRAWYRPDKPQPTPQDRRFVMERIESKAEGSLATALSIPVTTTNDEPAVLVTLSSMNSLERTVLPPGFGFAVFDKLTGEVLFHSQEQRSRRENLYRATDDNEELKAAIITRVRSELNLDYKGDKITAIVSPLWTTGWGLLVYYDRSLIEEINFHYGMTALGLSSAYIVLWLILAPLLPVILYVLYRYTLFDRLVAKQSIPRLPSWLFPSSADLGRHYLLTAILLLFCAAYLPMVFRLDLPHAKWWVLFCLLSIPFAWYLCLGAASKVVLNDEHTLTRKYFFFRLNVCLVAINIAVMPAMLLHNENYDVHNKLWNKFSNWNIGRQLQERYTSYTGYWDNYTVSPPSPGKRDFSWRGVYLPRTDIFRTDLSAPSASDTPGYTLLQERFPPRTLPEEQPDQDKGKEEKEKEKEKEKAEYIRQWNNNELNTLYLEIRTPDTQNTGYTLLPGPNATSRKHVIQPEQPSSTKTQLGYMRRTLALMPAIDDNSALLASFLHNEPVPGSYSTLCPSPQTGAVKGNKSRPSGAVADPMQERRQWSCVEDPQAGVAYLQYSYYPHTRPPSTAKLLIFNAALVMLSAIVLMILYGFLMRRFLNRQFERIRVDVDRNFTKDSFNDGGIVIFHPVEGESRSAFDRFLVHVGLSQPETRPPASLYSLTKEVTILSEQKWFVVKDFVSLIRNRNNSAIVMDQINDYYRKGYHTILLSDIDLDHWLYHRRFAQDMPEEEFDRWESLICALQTFILPCDQKSNACGMPRDPARAQYLIPRNAYRRTWELSSEDEHMVLAGLYYEGIVNPRNLYTLKALYRRYLVDFDNGHFQFTDPGWHEFVGAQMHRREFRHRARNYKNSLWREVRSPILLILLALLLFLAYVAQDEMRIVLSVFSMVATGLATFTGLRSRLQEFTLGNTP